VFEEAVASYDQAIALKPPPRAYSGFRSYGNIP
jgi:hypothetical protein